MHKIKVFCVKLKYYFNFFRMGFSTFPHFTLEAAYQYTNIIYDFVFKFYTTWLIAPLRDLIIIFTLPVVFNVC